MGLTEFLITVFVVVVLWAMWSLRNTEVLAYFKTKTGMGVAKGVLLALGFVILVTVGVSVVGCSGTYVNDASIYAGLDYTKKQSPQCEFIGPDDRTTSNLGLKLNLYESSDKLFNSDLIYTHHSCAFNPDDKSYDALGVQMEYKLWNR